jgi:hypothetical protein
MNAMPTGIVVALRSLGVSTQECGFEKSWDEDPYRAPRVMRYLHDPFSMLMDGRALLHAAETRDLPRAIALLTGLPEQSNHLPNSNVWARVCALRQQIEELYAQLPASLCTQVLTLTALQFADVTDQRARLPAAAGMGADPDALMERLRAADQWLYAAEDDDLRLLELLGQLPLERINALAWDIAHAVQSVDIALLDAVTLAAQGVLIGGAGDDVYTNADAWCIIDPGGNDRYIGLTGAASAARDRPLAIIIDCGGNDLYLGGQIGGPGSAVLGISIIHDREGDDIHDSTVLGTASGVGGAGIVIDERGSERYRGQRFAQGFGFFGTGALIDRAGNDIYEINAHGQAYGGVRGYGLLCDIAGNDVYIAGRDTPDTGRYDTRYISLAQGVGMGMRPCASGGLGCLIDMEGNDSYIADVFGQGVGYWYGVGMLVDARGEDQYQLYEYGQGAGIHMACGLLVEGAGNDAYVLRGGIGQGASHDFSVGVLLEQAGNDQYQGHITVQGTSINNGFALLTDEAGDDWYSSWSEWSQGYGAWAERRDFGSLGLCVDAAGSDYYHDESRNGFVSVRGWQGVCVDMPEEEQQ